MWRQPLYSNATMGYRRCFASSSSGMQKKALKALGQKSKGNTVAAAAVAKEDIQHTVLEDIQRTPPELPPIPPDTPPNGEGPRTLTLPKETETQSVPPLMGSALGQLHEFAPKIIVAGVGGAGGNALNNMIAKELKGMRACVCVALCCCFRCLHACMYLSCALVCV